jgi:four helix bundle protein
MTTEAFEDLKIWQEGRRLTNELYSLTRQQSFSNDFGFINQIRRAAISITSNIAEGRERGGAQEFAQFLSMAKGSSGEVRSCLHLAIDLGYVEIKTGEALITEFKNLSRMISNFMNYLKNPNEKGAKYKKPQPH